MYPLLLLVISVSTKGASLTARVQKIIDWPICKSFTEVHSFLGTIGTICIFIKNFAMIVHPLVNLIHKNIEFRFGKEELVAIKELKGLVKNSPTIHAIDYASRREVILAVDTLIKPEQ